MTDGIDDRVAESANLLWPDLDEGSNDEPMAWEGRVYVVALTWTMPGVILGLFVGLFGSLSMIGSGVIGGLAAALAGGLLEADYWS